MNVSSVYTYPIYLVSQNEMTIVSRPKVEKGLADLTKFRFEILVVVQEIVQKGFKRGEYVKNLQGEYSKLINVFFVENVFLGFRTQIVKTEPYY